MAYGIETVVTHLRSKATLKASDLAGDDSGRTDVTAVVKFSKINVSSHYPLRTRANENPYF